MAETAVCLVEVCSYAGTGNVLKIQDMLHICSEHASTKKAKKPAAAADEAAPATAESVEAATGEDVNMFESAANARAAAADSSGPGAAAGGSGGLEELQALLGGGIPGTAAATGPGAGAGAGAGSVADGPVPAPNGSATTADPVTPTSNTGGAGASPSANGPTDPAPEDEEDAAVEEGEPKPLKHQAVATLGIALIAMGEDIGSEMALRQFQHLVSPTLDRTIRY